MVCLAECLQTVVVKMYKSLRPGRGFVITGRSVHNARFKILCRDIVRAALFYTTTYSPFWRVQITSMCTMKYVPLLLAICVPPKDKHVSLTASKHKWNQHPLQSEGGLNPNKLWMAWYRDKPAADLLCKFNVEIVFLLACARS